MEKITMKRVEVAPPEPDANLAAGRLAKGLDDPENLGIGTLPGSSYKPIPPEHREMGDKFLLDLLGLPPERCLVIPAKGGGSGAIKNSLSAAKVLGYRPESLEFGAFDWAGYESFALTEGLTPLVSLSDGYAEYGASSPNALAIIQPTRNGSGRLLPPSEARSLTRINNQGKNFSIVDLPYFTGSDIENEALQAYLSESKETFAIAWSPTKIFQTFEDRPGGASIVVFPNAEERERFGWIGATVSRGTTGFDDAETRKLWEKMATSPDELNEKHERFKKFTETSREIWQNDSPEAYQALFDPEKFGGMFRLLPAQAETQKVLAEKHNVIAVLLNFQNDFRLRINTMGILDANGNPKKSASKTVKAVFAAVSSN